MNYAVCAKLCVPSDAEIELKLTGTESTNDAVVSAAEARVPKPAAIGDGGELAIRSAFRKDGAVKPKIVVDVASADGTPVVLFAEGPNAQWALPLPEPEAGAPAGQQRFSFALDGLPPGESARGATLRLTAVAGDKAIEAPFRLD
jgi:DsbC/DsbD-like thiol-disulfide interchange protein